MKIVCLLLLVVWREETRLDCVDLEQDYIVLTYRE